MRKIAANYIFLPGFPMVKNGYVELSGRRVVNVVNTGGTIKEIPGLEFYGGMIVAGELSGADITNKVGEDLFSWLENEYKKERVSDKGLAIIQGADLIRMTFRKEAVIEFLV